MLQKVTDVCGERWFWYFCSLLVPLNNKDASIERGCRPNLDLLANKICLQPISTDTE
jgi:hypothetical protein